MTFFGMDAEHTLEFAERIRSELGRLVDSLSALAPRSGSWWFELRWRTPDGSSPSGS